MEAPRPIHLKEEELFAHIDAVLVDYEDAMYKAQSPLHPDVSPIPRHALPPKSQKDEQSTDSSSQQSPQTWARRWGAITVPDSEYL